MMLKKHMTPLSKKGQLVKSANKGHAMQPPRTPFTRNTNPGAASINDYAKQTPMAQPSEQLPGVPDGLE